MAKLFRGTTGDDKLVGMDTDENLFLDTGIGKDIVTGGSRNDRFVLSTDQGVDLVDGRGGEDTIDYSRSLHRVHVDLGSGTVTANLGTDSAPNWQTVTQVKNVEDVVGSKLDDTIFGSDGNNRLDGYAGDDTIHARGGDDTLIGGTGANWLDGGDGTDTADYSSSDYSVLANLTNHRGAEFDTATQTFKSDDTYSSIENLTGSRYSDLLIGDSGDNVIDGGAGDDLIAGSGGNDTLYGGAGDDQVSAVGTAVGTTTRMFGDDGNDILNAGAGVDIIDGGNDTDWVDYSFQTQQSTPTWGLHTAHPGVYVDLAAGRGYGGWASGDTYVNVENVRGTNFDDRITGDVHANVLVGMDGDDTIGGGGGDDTILGGRGDDTLYGNAGNDTLSDYSGTNHFDGGDGIDTVDYSNAMYGVVVDMSGLFVSGTYDSQHNLQSNDSYSSIENVLGSNQTDFVIADNNDNVIRGNGGADLLFGMGGNDTIDGGDQNDIIEGGTGADTLDGGTGVNTLSYALSSTGVVVNLGNGTASGGDASGDTFTNFQNVFGSNGNDVLIGSSADNLFYEQAGNNQLIGGGGHDTFAFAQELTGLTQVLDFHVGEDQLAFIGTHTLQDLSFTQAAGGTIIHIDGESGAIYLAGVNTLDFVSHLSSDVEFTSSISDLLQ